MVAECWLVGRTLTFVLKVLTAEPYLDLSPHRMGLPC